MKFGNMVSKATSDDEVPTPGFLQEELKRLTWDPSACSILEDSILSRLEKKSANIRLKTLRLMKMLIETGSVNFKRDLQRRTQAVRDCLHFRGDPHPTMGDLPSKMVRDTAQEVINAIFETENSEDRRVPPPPAQANVAPSTAAKPAASVPSGIPASSVTPSRPSPSETNKYTGFGSESFGNRGPDPGHRSIDSYFSNNAASATLSSQAQNDSGVNDLMNKAGSAISAGLSQLTGKPAGLVQSYPEIRQAELPPSQGGWQAPPDIPTGNGLGGMQDVVRSAAGQYEETLVQSLTAEGGVRAAPPKEELKALCAKAKSLDMPLLIMLLCSKLEGDVWQSRSAPSCLPPAAALCRAPTPTHARSGRAEAESVERGGRGEGDEGRD